MSIFHSKMAYERHENRIAELETAHDKLGSTIRRLELEYIELYDKVRHQMSRMAKRSPIDPPPLVDETLVAEPDDGVDEISARILARRSGSRTAT